MLGATGALAVQEILDLASVVLSRDFHTGRRGHLAHVQQKVPGGAVGIPELPAEPQATAAGRGRGSSEFPGKRVASAA